jgi:hypothetical protein
VLKFIACTREERLTEEGKEAKKRFSEKALRAYRRLSSIPMPDSLSALSRGFSYIEPI